MNKKYTFVDLFAGAGGLSEGFVRAGYEPIAHIEMNSDACDSLRTRAAFHYLRENNQLEIYDEYLKNKKEKTNGKWLWDQVPDSVTDTVINATIGPETIEDIFNRVDKLRSGRSVDIIIGGPPCQAYSLVGRARMGEKIEDDPRNELYKYYVKFLEKYKPKMFVFENVLGIKTAKKGEPLRDLTKLCHELDYEIIPEEQIASNFGVLQNRHRMIIVGWRKHRADNTPTSYHYPKLTPSPMEYTIRKDLFADLPERKAGEGSLCGITFYTKDLEEMEYLKESGIRTKYFPYTTQHVARPTNANDRQIYKKAIELWNKGKRLKYSELDPALQKHKNKEMFLNRFCVIDPNGSCHTLVAHIAMDGHYYIYPTEHPTLDNVRSITVREAARIQSFPDDYFFEGSRTAAFRQIGNAVPVILAEKIGIELYQILSDEDRLS